MKFGIALTTSVSPVFREFEQKEYILEVAKISEARGYESVWVSDRTVYPNDIAERYPDQFGKGKADPNSQNVMESLITLSFIAGKTQKLLLGTSVLVLPFRNPLLNTKMISTLDVLSDGRLIIGVGTGWMLDECCADPHPVACIFFDHCDSFIRRSYRPTLSFRIHAYIVHDDLGALVCECECMCSTDAMATAGDDSYFILEVLAHEYSFCSGDGQSVYSSNILVRCSNLV